MTKYRVYQCFGFFLVVNLFLTLFFPRQISQPLFSQQQNNNAAKAPTVVISGKVTTSEGLGLNMVRITISSDVTQIVYTNGSGIYSASVTSGKDYQVEAKKENYFFTPVNFMLNSLVSDIIDLNFTAYRFYRITSIIKDESNHVLPNIKISLTGDKTEDKLTTPAGSVIFDSLIKGNYVITPSSSNYTFSPSKYRFNSLSSDATQKNFIAAEVVTYKISGYIKNENGDGLADVEVYLSGDNLKLVKSNNNGFFEFTGLSDGSYTIQAAASGYSFSPILKYITISGSSSTNNEFTAKKFYRISGTINDKLNKPVPDVQVLLNGSKAATKQTDNFGYYYFDTLYNGTYNIQASLYSYYFVPDFINIDINNSSSSDNNFFADKLELFTISGKVIDMNGKGITNTTINLSGKNNITTISLNDGSFSFVDVEKGNYTISFSNEKYVFMPQIFTFNLDKDINNLVIKAFPYYSISGFIKNSNGKPVAGIKLRLSGDSLYKFSKTDITGRFIFDSLLNGNYTLKTEESDYKFVRDSILILNLKSKYIIEDLIVQRFFSISGKIIDPLKRAWGNITVMLFGKDTIIMKTDQNGLFSFRNIIEGDIKLVFQGKDISFDPDIITYLPITKNESDILVSGYISISGNVLSSSAAPIDGMKIMLSGSVNDSSVSKQDGSYKIDRLPSGKYVVFPISGSHTFIPQQYSYDSIYSCKYFQNFTASSNLSISGKVTDTKSQPIGNIKVTLSNNRFVLTNSSGNFQFQDIAPGKYTVSPSDTLFNFYPHQVDCEIISTSITDIIFTAKRIVDISGKVTDLNKTAISGVEIRNQYDTTIYTVTDSIGVFSFNRLESNNYSFSLHKPGLYFNPPILELNAVNSSIYNIKVTGYLKICGHVVDSFLLPIKDAVITLNDETNRTWLSDEKGYFEIDKLPFGSYRTAISKKGYSFFPESRKYQNINSSIKTDTFFAKKLFCISGKIHDINNRNIENVTLAITGDTTLLFKSANEYYIPITKKGIYLLTPIKAGMKFSPQYANIFLEKDIDSLNFLGYITISGKVIDTLQKPKSGVKLELIGESSKDTYTNNEGYFFFDSLCPGKYIVIPSCKNQCFTPENILFQNLTSISEENNFTSRVISTNAVSDLQGGYKEYLLNNYPNPFNSSTSITFSLEQTSFVSLSIVDIMGREVCALINKEKLSPDNYTVKWNSGFGSDLSSGVYFYVLKISNDKVNKSLIKRMLLLK